VNGFFGLPQASFDMFPFTDFSKKSMILVHPRWCQWVWEVDFLDVLNAGESEKMTRSILYMRKFCDIHFIRKMLIDCAEISVYYFCVSEVVLARIL